LSLPAVDDLNISELQRAFAKPFVRAALAASLANGLGLKPSAVRILKLEIEATRRLSTASRLRKLAAAATVKILYEVKEVSVEDVQQLQASMGGFGRQGAESQSRFVESFALHLAIAQNDSTSSPDSLLAEVVQMVKVGNVSIEIIEPSAVMEPVTLSNYSAQDVDPAGTLEGTEALTGVLVGAAAVCVAILLYVLYRLLVCSRKKGSKASRVHPEYHSDFKQPSQPLQDIRKAASVGFPDPETEHGPEVDRKRHPLQVPSSSKSDHHNVPASNLRSARNSQKVVPARTSLRTTAASDQVFTNISEVVEEDKPRHAQGSPSLPASVRGQQATLAKARAGNRSVELKELPIVGKSALGAKSREADISEPSVARVQARVYSGAKLPLAPAVHKVVTASMCLMKLGRRSRLRLS